MIDELDVEDLQEALKNAEDAMEAGSEDQHPASPSRDSQGQQESELAHDEL